VTIISPSLLACDFLNIEAELARLESESDLWLHLDIMDGHFVPNLTFGHPILQLIASKTNLPLDAHFMVTNPDFYIETMKDLNLHVFTFHVEACSDAIATAKSAKSVAKKVGVSLRPSTPLSSLSDDLLKQIDLVLIMSVEPGFGGQKFMPESISRIQELKAKRTTLNANFLIEVDGGVSSSNSESLINAGADVLVAGSAIFKSDKHNYSETISKLRGNP
tara:strand:+ start:15547 stop:16206 length:660 start_codon:yes stop_codon:yes gene_type:complete